MVDQQSTRPPIVLVLVRSIAVPIMIGWVLALVIQSLTGWHPF